MPVGILPRLARCVPSEDGKHISGELNNAFATVDGVDMSVEKPRTEQDRTRQLVHDHKRDAVQGVAESDAKEDFAGRAEDVARRITQCGHVFVRRDVLLPSRWQCTSSYHIVSSARVKNDLRRHLGLVIETYGCGHGVMQRGHDEVFRLNSFDFLCLR